MKLYLHKLLCTILCAFLIFGSIVPNTVVLADTVYSFGTVNTGGLNVRNEVNGKTFVQLSRNTVVQILQSITGTEFTAWYAIYVPESKISGFVQAKYITTMSPQESAAYAASHANIIWKGSQGNINNPTGYVRVTQSGTNLRDRANGNTVTQADKDIVFPYYAQETAGGYNWYKIYLPQYGYLYIRADYAALTNGTGYLTVTPQPNAPSTFGTITTILDNINLRQSNRVNATRIGRVGISQTYALLESPSTNDGFTWYKINAGNGLIGYIRGDCAQFNNNASPSTPSVTAAPANPGSSAGVGYGVVITLPAATLRQSPDGRKIGTINANQTIPVSGPPITRGAYTWYPVNVNLVAGYLRNDSVNYIAGNQTPGGPSLQPGGQNPSLPQPPQGGTPSKNLITILDKVNLRVSPSRASRAAYNVPLGTAFPYSRETYVGRQKWYKIAYKASELWVLGSTVRILSTLESSKIKDIGGVQSPDQTTNNPSGYIVTIKGAVNIRGTAGGKTISTIPRRGTVLQHYGTTSTRNNIWYKINTNGIIGFVRADCVKPSNQNGEHLNPNGNNPNAPGNGRVENKGDFKLFKPVRKSDWNTGEMNRLWPRGTTYTVYDVQTGKTFRARRWAGGKHIDAEPLTSADTAVICSMYGVRDASQIKSNRHWHGRPLWITINGVTYCASMYGVPHNLAGNTIKNNNYEGQFCIHFTNSTGHTTGAKPSQNHIRAIEEAFRKGQ